MRILFIAFLFCLPVLLGYAGIQLGKSGEAWSKEVAEIEATVDLPESMDFFYSKWSVLWDLAQLTFVTVLLLGLNFLWLGTPGNQSKFFASQIALSIIFLPSALFFAWQTKKAGSKLVHIKDPVIKVCRTGCRFGKRFHPWTSIGSIKSGGLRGQFLIIPYDVADADKQEKFTVDLLHLSQPHLSDYIRAYLSAYALPEKPEDTLRGNWLLNLKKPTVYRTVTVPT